MKTTMRQVAEAAGVSTMAVSYVLHGTGKNVRVSQSTADRIRRVAAELEYRPNIVARSLRNRQTQMIGVVFQRFGRLTESNPYYPMLLNGVMSALFPQQYTLALSPELIQGGNEDAIFDGRFDGILWARPDFRAVSVERLKSAQIPLVFMHAPPGSVPGMSTFCADNESALKLIVQHLSELQHQNLCFVIEEINEATAEGRARMTAFLAATAECGVRGEVFVWNESLNSFSDYLQENPKISAMACFSDALAGLVLNTCMQLEIQVPRDLSVVGFDSSSFCERTSPRLTSVHQPVELIAYDAVVHLLSIIRDHGEGIPTSPTSSTYKCNLDVRDSTAVCPEIKR